MTRKYRKAQIGQEDFFIVDKFPGDDPMNDDILWVKVKRPTGRVFSQLTALRGLTKIDEVTGVPVLAMNPVDAMVQLLPENIIEWNMTDVETDQVIPVSLDAINDMDPGDFQHLLNAFSASVTAARNLKPAPKVDAPKTEITQDEKKELPPPLASASVPSEAGPTPERQLHLVVPSANG